MTRSLRIQYPGACYHVTCRGNERREIFRDEADRKLFLDQLRRSLRIFHVTLLAYALMPNHFHLLVITPEGNLSEFMRHFNISYTSAFNRKHGRVGHLYQGRYKSFLIDADNYLLAVSRYIHLNPLRVKSGDRMAVRGWEALLTSATTSLPGYAAERKAADFVSYSEILSYTGGAGLPSRAAYLEFVKEGLKEPLTNPLDSGKKGNIVGNDGFAESLRQWIAGGGESEREQPDFRNMKRRFEPARLMAHFFRITGTAPDEVCPRGRHAPERAMLMEALYRYCRITQPEIGKLVGGVDYSTVSRSRSRLRAGLEQNGSLKERFEQILCELDKCKE